MKNSSLFTRPGGEGGSGLVLVLARPSSQTARPLTIQPNGFFGVAAQPPPAHGIFRGLFGHGGRGAAAAAEAAAQERSRVRRRVSESPGVFERTGHAMDTYLTPPRRGQHPQ